MKRVIPIIIVSLALAIVAFQMLDPCTGKVLYEWQSESSNFKLRWEVREGRCLAYGCLVVFKSAPAGSEDWREVVTSWIDEPYAIPRDRLRFADANVGYIFHSEKYAVTIDAGRTWSIWEAKQSFPNQEKSLFFIDEVSINPDGRGWMQLSIYPLGGENFHRELRTTDYGRSWQVD